MILIDDEYINLLTQYLPVKRLLSDTIKEMFGIDRQVSNLEVVVFYLLVIVTTTLAVYML